ncbi:MAG: RNA-binding domain-containing protein [Bacteroidales bacterium]
MDRNPQQESETIEYKESLAEKEVAGRDICAFANKNGGTLYFGIKNDGTYVSISTVTEKTLRDLAQFYHDNFEPRLYPEIIAEKHEEQQVIKIAVGKSSTPHHIFKGIPYIRIGSTSTKMAQVEYQKRLVHYRDVAFDFSAEICRGLKLEDLSETALTTLRAKWAEKEGKDEYLRFSHKEVLEKLLLIRNGQLTYAALILSGKHEKIGEFLPEAEIRFGWKNDPRKLDFDFTKDWREPFLNILDEIWEAVNARNSRFPFEEGFFEGDIWAFDQKSIREAVLNAVAHRDYRERGSVFLEASIDNFTAKSPGNFLPGVSPENALDSQGKWRNRLLMETLGKIGFVERYGHGLDRIFKKSISEGKGAPILRETSAGFVELQIPAQVKDKNFVYFLAKISKEKQIRFDFVKDLIFLETIRQKQFSLDAEKRNKFLKLGIIEKIGRGRGTKYILSNQFYDFLDRKGEYTRKKWFSKNQQKELLLKFFQQHKKGRMPDLRDGIFEGRLSNQQINLLLDELRKEGKIYFEGPQRSQKAYWKLNDRG